MKKQNEEQVAFKLDYEDLQDLKDICKAILNTNIAVKTFHVRHVKKVEDKKTEKDSIRHSKRGLEMLEQVENPESLNKLIREGVGDDAWGFFVSVLTMFSGVLSDPHFYEYDKGITEQKKKESN